MLRWWRSKSKKKEHIEVDVRQVRSIMKEDLGMRYRMSLKIPTQAISTRCLVLRQQYAMEMIQ